MQAAAIAVAVLTGAVLAVAPMARTYSCVAGDPDGGLSCSSRRESLVANEGLSVLIFLALPVVLTLAAVFLPVRALRIAAAALIGALVLLGAASIGLFFAPTAVLAVLAATAERSS